MESQRDNISESFRLSPQQRRLWRLQRDSLAYRAQCAVAIKGNLHAEVLTQAVEEVVGRHEILRTTFPLPSGMKVPFQAIADRGAPFWDKVDLTRLSPIEQAAEIESRLKEQRRAPFDFERGPLLRLALLALSTQKHALLVCLPSLCADAVTLKNLVREIGESYAARLQGGNLPAEGQRYVQFSEWQNELLEAPPETGARRRPDFSTAARLKLPFERGACGGSFAPEFLALTIEPATARKVEASVRERRVSIFVFLLACWQILLRRLAGEPDIVVGAVFAGRKFAELGGALGLFAQALPIAGRLEEDFSLSEVLRRASEAAADADERQEYFTWERSAAPETQSSEPEFFPMQFELEERLEARPAGGALFSIDTEYACIDRFKIKLRCLIANASLTLEFHYDSGLFAADDIERLAGQFHALLESVVNNPEIPLGEMNLLSGVERRRLLAQFNDAKTDDPKDKCIHELFEEQAARAPDNVAVAHEDRRLTYQELNRRANQLAYYLRRAGVGPEAAAALCVERSPEMVIGMLGILKAGGAYVPLDPVLPKERLDFMLEDSRARVLVTERRLMENFSARAARVICLDASEGEISREDEGNPTGGATPENSVYVLYTSGSTGKPKGVVIEHRQLVHYVNGITRSLDLPPGASFATVSTFAADLGNTAIFPALCSGGCLHVISRERAADAEALGDYFARHPVDCLKIAPSHLTALIHSSSRPERLLPRRRLVLGGEASSWELIEKIQALAPDCVIFNHYGPTETTVGATTYRVERGRADRRCRTVPVGRPITNTAVYLLDERLHPVPIWQPGELYIGGNGVGRGYLNRPELTTEKFIADPFSAEPGARLYKTGDRARYLPDGDIEFLGRIDDQVKIRGFRVEPGEVEVMLSQHSAVKESVVVAREDAPNEKRLAAYVVAAREPAPTGGELRGFLQQKLPDHMIPSVFVFLRSLPLMPNGKIDRRALPPPDAARPETGSVFVGSRNPTEATLAAIWAQILRLERVGIHDNFFDLGGHSLLATQIISRVRDAFQVEMPLRTLFDAPTVAAMADAIQKAKDSGAGSAAGKISPVTREPRRRKATP